MSRMVAINGEGQIQLYELEVRNGDNEDEFFFFFFIRFFFIISGQKRREKTAFKSTWPMVSQHVDAFAVFSLCEPGWSYVINLG